jgi:hypothetical protein
MAGERDEEGEEEEIGHGHGHGHGEDDGHGHGHGDQEDRERGHRRGPLSEEVANRWAPERLMKVVSSRAGRGEPLDATTRARYEKKLGTDLGGVRIYSGEFAESVTRAHGAEAVTVGGTGMVMMSGTPDRSPATAAGQALLAHELTHVAQASRGGPAAGVHRSQAPGERALATEEHEAEAEAVEAEVMAEGGGSGGSGGGPTQADAERAEAELMERIKERTLELLEEDEWVSQVRGGRDPVRP